MIPSFNKRRKRHAVLFALIVSTALILSEVNEQIAVSLTLLSNSIDAPVDNSNNNIIPQPQEESTNRRLNILSLGGSVTWGARLSNRDDAYPFRLKSDYNHNVQNLAIRATGMFNKKVFIGIHSSINIIVK